MEYMDARSVEAMESWIGGFVGVGVEALRLVAVFVKVEAGGMVNGVES
jgi:hypothetical protein